MQAPPGGRFYWRAGYAFSSAEDVIGGEGVPRSWDQTHAGSFLGGYRVGDRWFFSLAGTAHTGWPTTPFRTDIVVDPGEEPDIAAVLGPRNSDRFPTYVRFDLKASGSFPVRPARCASRWRSSTCSTVATPVASTTSRSRSIPTAPSRSTARSGSGWD